MKTKKISLPLIRSIVFSLVLVFFTITAGAKEKIVIGQAISLSGPLAASNAVVSAPYYDLWVKDVNAKGGIFVKEYGKRLPVELVMYDDKSDIGTMTRLLEKLILREKVDFILPPWSTSMLFAAAPIANKHQYILIGGAGGALKLKEFDLPYFFQSLNFAETQVPALADVFKELGIKKVAIISHEDLHGVEYSEYSVPEFEKRGLEIVLNKKYPMGAKDLSPLLKQAKAAGADALCGYAYPDGVMLATSQSVELGINFKAYSMSVGPAFSFFKGAFGEQLIEGIIGGGAWNEKSFAGAKQFSEHYVDVMGKPVGNYWGSLFFYAAMEHFEQAVEKAGTLDQPVIRDILATEIFNTALGPYWYDEHRVFINHPGEIGQWQNGVFEVIDPGWKRTAKPILKPEWPSK